MSLVQAGGYDVIGARIVLPRIGAWWIDATLATTDPVAIGAAMDVVAEGGGTWSGKVVRSRTFLDGPRIRIVGASGLASDASPQFYSSIPADNVARDIVSAAGEALDSSVSLTQPLAFWAIRRGSCGAALGDLANALGLGWRVLGSGSVWVGSETWPDGPTDMTELLDVPTEDRTEYGVETPAAMPGTTIDGRHASRVEHLVEPERIRTLIWWEP